MIKWKRVSAERYDEMLNVLPPLDWTAGGFLVGEASSQRDCQVTGVERTTYTGFQQVNGEYFETVRDVTRPEFRSRGIPGKPFDNIEE